MQATNKSDATQVYEGAVKSSRIGAIGTLKYILKPLAIFGNSAIIRLNLKVGCTYLYREKPLGPLAEGGREPNPGKAPKE